MAGTTRDVMTHPVTWERYHFDLTDTGGMFGASQDPLHELVKAQGARALKSADLIVMVVDGRAGMLPEDKVVYRAIKMLDKPFVVVVNKCDKTLEAQEYLTDFYELGAELIPAAFEADFGIDNTVEWIIANLKTKEVTEREGFRLAVLGKPNAGKSSLTNCLLGKDRMLVSPTAGTTVDAVEAEFTYAGEKYIIADTAGLRRAAKQKDGIEVLSGFKTREAIRDADIVLLVIDSLGNPSNQDSRLIELCSEMHKTLIVVANKFDLAKDTQENFREYYRDLIERQFHFFTDIPVVFCSAKTGAGIDTLFKKIADIRTKLQTRISTSQLNKFFTDVIKQAPAPVFQTQNVKFYYLTQTQQKPPSFIAFANHPEGVTPAYRRFLKRKISENWNLEGIPLRIFVMEKGG